MFTAAPGTIIVYGDIACPWAHLAVHRLWTTRARLGLEGRVLFDLRAFPLELFNRRATPKPVLDAEVAVVGGLDPGAGWHTWDRPVWEYPGTSLLALEAVQAAKAQGLAAAEELDRRLRRAFFRDRRNISLRHEVVEAATRCSRLDADRLVGDLDDGRARRRVIEQKIEAEEARVEGSPHLFLPDGTDVHNPGIERRMEPGGFPVIDKDDPGIYEDLIGRTARGSDERQG